MAHLHNSLPGNPGALHSGHVLNTSPEPPRSVQQIYDELTSDFTEEEKLRAQMAGNGQDDMNMDWLNEEPYLSSTLSLAPAAGFTPQTSFTPPSISSTSDTPSLPPAAGFTPRTSFSPESIPRALDTPSLSPVAGFASHRSFNPASIWSASDNPLVTQPTAPSRQPVEINAGLVAGNAQPFPRMAPDITLGEGRNGNAKMAGFTPDDMKFFGDLATVPPPPDISFLPQPAGVTPNTPFSLQSAVFTPETSFISQSVAPIPGTQFFSQPVGLTPETSFIPQSVGLLPETSFLPQPARMAPGASFPTQPAVIASDASFLSQPAEFTHNNMNSFNELLAMPFSGTSSHLQSVGFTPNNMNLINELPTVSSQDVSFVSQPAGFTYGSMNQSNELFAGNTHNNMNRIHSQPTVPSPGTSSYMQPAGFTHAGMNSSNGLPVGYTNNNMNQANLQPTEHINNNMNRIRLPPYLEALRKSSRRQSIGFTRDFPEFPQLQATRNIFTVADVIEMYQTEAKKGFLRACPVMPEMEDKVLTWLQDLSSSLRRKRSWYEAEFYVDPIVEYVWKAYKEATNPGGLQLTGELRDELDKLKLRESHRKIAAKDYDYSLGRFPKVLPKRKQEGKPSKYNKYNFTLPGPSRTLSDGDNQIESH